MNSEPIPPYVFVILYGMGIVLIGIAIPLIRRRVKPNGLYGIRLPAAFEDESVWYDINALGGKHLVVIAVVYLVLLTVAVVFLETWSDAPRFLVPVGFLTVALVIDGIILFFVSNRMLEQRRASPGSTASR